MDHPGMYPHRAFAAQTSGFSVQNGVFGPSEGGGFKSLGHTLPKTNIAPENRPPQ